MYMESDISSIESNDNVKMPDLEIHHRSLSVFSLCLDFFPALFLSGIGALLTGILLDKVQRWRVFTSVPQMFILVPALLDMKGDLEMTLNSRLSTEVNYHPIKPYIWDHLRTWKSVVWSNIAVAQIQAIVLGTISAIWAIALNLLFGNHKSIDVEDMAILFSTSTITASVSAFLICGLMSIIIILSPRYGLNPDNFANPITSTLGDFTTLFILANTGDFFFEKFTTNQKHYIIIPTLMVFAMIPFWMKLSLSNFSTRIVLKTGWIPILSAMVISAISGLILESEVGAFPMIALLTPLLNGIGGSIGAVLASRTATSLHIHGKLDSANAGKAMYLCCIPIHCLMFVITDRFSSYSDQLQTKFFATYLVAGGLQIFLVIYAVRKTSIYIWSKGLDPDNWVIPFITAISDIIGTGLLTLFLNLTAKKLEH